MSINNLERFRAKIAAGTTCVGTVISLSDPAVSELAGEAGFDFTWIDMEHTPQTILTVMNHIMVQRGVGCAPFVRVPWNEWGIIKPVLDLAPAGIIIPMVNSAEAAAEAVASCKYPPRGNRGWGPRRGMRYGAAGFDEYRRDPESDPLVIVQVEHIEAVRNLDAILAVPGIDSICVGPADLSGSMGKLCRMDDPELNAAIDEVAAKTKRAGLLLGTYSTDLPRWKARGVDWIAVTGDCGSMFRDFRSVLDAGRGRP